MFSDILTPLSGMNIPFDIIKGKGPVIFDPPRTATDVEKVREFIPEESVPYVGEALTILRKEVCSLFVLFFIYMNLGGYLLRSIFVFSYLEIPEVEISRGILLTSKEEKLIASF